jgi:hypothetical protein
MTEELSSAQDTVAENQVLEAADVAEKEITTIDDVLENAIQQMDEKPEAETVEEVKEVSTEPQVAPSSDVPEHWSNEDKAEYAKVASKLDNETKEFIKNMDRRWYKRNESRVHELKAENSDIKEAFAPYEANMRANGITPGEAIRSLINERQQFIADLRENGLSAVKRLADKNNIPLNLTNSEDEAEYVDPVVRQLQSEVGNLRSQLTQINSDYSIKQAHVNIDTFASQKDEQGNLLHPHFDKVLPEITKIVVQSRAVGGEVTLKEAYEQAIYLNSEVREQIVQDRAKAELRKQEEQRRAEVDKARKASTNLSGRAPARKMRSATPSLDDAFDEALAQLKAS